ncbi:M3 family oligoendopeptidase [soil metagenome]
MSDTTTEPIDRLPQWSVADVHESMGSRSFLAAMERAIADTDRAVARFDELGIRDISPRPATPADGEAADAAIEAYNGAARQLDELRAFVYATVSTDSRDEAAQSTFSELSAVGARLTPLLARFADWVHAIYEGSGGPEALNALSELAADHVGPLTRLAERSAHQMTELEEGLYAQLTTVGSSAWSRLQADLTSQLTAPIEMDGVVSTRPIATVRGLATHLNPAVRRAAYDAELRAWPQVAVACAAAMNAVKGEANIVNRRRNWADPLEASLFANAVSRPTFDAMYGAVLDVLPDFRRWMRIKATLHASWHGGTVGSGLAWSDLVAPLPLTTDELSWDDGVAIVRAAFSEYDGRLGALVDRAIDEQWIDAGPREGKVGGAFCMPFIGGRSLVLLNWSGSADSAQTTAHELGHAYHNTTLAERTPLQRRLPMALAETASIFCETLVVESGLRRLGGADRLALLDLDLAGANQVVVDIHSRLLFETEIFARRQRRTLGVSELNELMLQAQAEAYGDGLDQSTAHPYMWALKPHYYGSHYYNWPYTYGLLFGLGLFACYQRAPEAFRSGYETLLSRAGMDTAEQLGAAFGIDVTTPEFWTASCDVLRDRIDQYEQLATEVGPPPP